MRKAIASAAAISTTHSMSIRFQRLRGAGVGDSVVGVSDGVVGGPPRFTIITTRPNHLVAAVHDRMPLLVPPARIDDWLTAAAPVVVDLIAPAPETTLIATPVSKHVNSVKNDDSECVLPVELAAKDPQGSLF